MYKLAREDRWYLEHVLETKVTDSRSGPLVFLTRMITAADGTVDEDHMREVVEYHDAGDYLRAGRKQQRENKKYASEHPVLLAQVTDPYAYAYVHVVMGPPSEVTRAGLLGYFASEIEQRLAN